MTKQGMVTGGFTFRHPQFSTRAPHPVSGTQGAVESMFESLSVYMIVGIIAVIAASQFNRTLGAILSVLFWGAVAFVGNAGYEAGHAVGLPGIPFSRPVFLGVCGFFVLLHVAAAATHVANKRRRDARQAYLDDED